MQADDYLNSYKTKHMENDSVTVATRENISSDKERTALKPLVCNSNIPVTKPTAKENSTSAVTCDKSRSERDLGVEDDLDLLLSMDTPSNFGSKVNSVQSEEHSADVVREEKGKCLK